MNKYKEWSLTTIEDVFNYNYIEDINNKVQKIIAEELMELSYTDKRTKKQFEIFHLKLVESGIALLPTTQKAIDRLRE
jgi:hypothetical protein